MAFSYAHADEVENSPESLKEKKLDKRNTCSTCSYNGRTYYTYADGTTVQRLIYRDQIQSRGIQNLFQILFWSFCSKFFSTI